MPITKAYARNRYLILTSACLLLAAMLLPAVTRSVAADHRPVPGRLRVNITVDTGFFDRDGSLVEARIQFGGPVAPESMKFLRNGEDTPFAVLPDDGHTGILFWALPRPAPSLTGFDYVLLFSPGDEPAATPWGDAVLLEKAESGGNLIPNGSFETLGKTVPRRANWHGDALPESWDLRDYAWAHRELPAIQARCRLYSGDAYEGQNSIEFVTELRDAPDGVAPLLVSGYAVGEVFPLLPDEDVHFSYRVKFTEVEEMGRSYEGISAEIQFLDEERQRIHPKDYAVNRLQAAYSTNRNPRDSWLDRWVEVEARKTTPPETRYGRVWISCSMPGRALVDKLDVRPTLIGAASPVTIKVSSSMPAE